MFDIFYSGIKPNLFAHEQQANSIEHAQELSRTRYFWWINYLTDYKGHDFLWEPVPWQKDQRHVWPSQHQANGGTQLVPKQGSTDINYDHPVLPRTLGASVIGIDHGNGMSVQCDITTRFINSYLGTLRRVLSKLDPVIDEYVWVVSSVCDYTWFNFTWHPSEWQQDMLHVFPSQDQKFGDTFYIHVPTFLERSKNLALLEWYDTIHFVDNIQVPRRPIPVVKHGYDTHVQAVWEYEFQEPVVEFTVDDYDTTAPVLNLWREEVRAVTPLTPGASRVLVPRDAKNYLKTQLYDYPTIDKTQRTQQDQPLDIVFIDNGEANADHNYFHLKWVADISGAKNKIHRSSGVNGRVAAYQAAAGLSTTPWFFAVFAKLRVDKHFDWSWQPDRLQEPKHYIFYAFNPVTGLTYGHQAMIAYNRTLVLGNTGTGLDFTLDSAHEVVPVVSGTAEYADTKWSAWRTAFREVLKLKCNTDVDSQYRLGKWLTVAHGLPNGQWSIYGAEDAVEYYDSVAGDFDALKKSYDWQWLASYAFMRRGLAPGQ